MKDYTYFYSTWRTYSHSVMFKRNDVRKIEERGHEARSNFSYIQEIEFLKTTSNRRFEVLYHAKRRNEIFKKIYLVLVQCYKFIRASCSFLLIKLRKCII